MVFAAYAWWLSGRASLFAEIVDGFPDEANDIAKQIYSDFNKEHGTDYKFQLK